MSWAATWRSAKTKTAAISRSTIVGPGATIHKAQGVTVDRAHVLASEHMDRHAAYVALTRHRDGVALHWSAEALGDRAGLGRTSGRERLKDTSLDYPLDAGPGYGAAYAERRGVDPLRPDSAIVVPQPGLKADQGPKQAPKAPAPAAAKPLPVPGAGLAERVAQGQARFLERFEARQRQLAEKAANDEGARALVGRWDRAVTGFTAALPRLDTDPAYGPARKAMLELGRDFGAQPGAVAVLRERGDAFGMGERQTLAQVLADPRPERAMGAMVETAETKTRAQLQEQAQQRAAQAAAHRQEQSYRPQLTPRGPRMGM